MRDFQHFLHRHRRSEHGDGIGIGIARRRLRGGREGRGGGRIFGHGGLRFVLLQLIADKPSHGYELIKSIEERLGGTYSPSPGIVYPTLTLLEEMGYVSVDAMPAAASATASPRPAANSSPPTARSPRR